ncbi:hypothetical protein FRX31_023448 [Thalictrum thalictroides]|uniref:No apical meristem-associated C-terminal domain-containing protein n=1 Tax=Thalictrum thalictroides TaxID=46969 RepID=A0A7J6VRV7_THATH|nr:hypothetical protein FRX31_023448 [Thalictrum thalictroides]
MCSKIESTYNGEAADEHGYIQRTIVSLQGRWVMLNKACLKFGGCIKQVMSFNESGSSEMDILDKAKQMYATSHEKNKLLTYDHAWNILKFHDKWSISTQERSPRINNSPGINDSPGLTAREEEGNDIRQIGEASAGRPSNGRNASKSRRRVVEDNDPMWVELRENSRRNMEFMEKQRMDTLRIAATRDTRAKERNDNEKQWLAMLQEDRDKVIMDTDMIDFTPGRKMFHSNLRMDVLTRQCQRTVARNLFFCGEGSSNQQDQSNDNSYNHGQYNNNEEPEFHWGPNNNN